MRKEVEKISTKKLGRPKLLPEKVMEKTINLIKSLQLKGALVNVNVTKRHRLGNRYDQ